MPEPTHFEAAVPQFSVPDLVRTVEYYRDTLGFGIVGYWDGERVTSAGDDASVFAIVQRDDVQVFFSRASDPGPAPAGASGAYDAYFRVRGVDMLAAELRRRGAIILDGPEDRVYGQREIIVQDCDGLILAFAEPANLTP